VRGRIEAVLDWAKARGYREGDNPARWRGHLDKLLPNRRKLRKVRNHPAMPYPELPAFMAELRDRNSVSANALEFCVLTAARTGEVIGARWPEIDLEAGIWTVPAERMKVGREHRIPLSKRALDILATLPREAGSEFVFMGAREGKPLSNIAMLELLRGLKPNAEYVPHGFRSSFRDWAAEQTSYPSEVVEMALAHTVSDKTIAAYKRTDLFERRARLMNDWGSFCANPLLLGDVVQLRKPVA
jgi:integrase